MFTLIFFGACLLSYVSGQCTDNQNYRLRPFAGAPLLTCSEVADQYPYHCTDASTSNIADNPGGQCCASCRDLPNSVKKCTDLPGPGLSITGTSVTGQTCDDMTTDWPAICHPDIWGGKWNTCCRSCRDKDVDYKTCVDIVGTITLNHGDGTSSSGLCPDLTDYCDSYSLGGIRNYCCGSCPCTDNPNASVTVGKGGVTCTDCTCAELVAISPDTLVHLKKACCKNKNNAREDCCATCLANIQC